MYSKKFQVVFYLLLVLFLQACGEASVDEDESNLNGRVVKGVMQNAVVNIFTLQSNGESEQLIGSTRTDDNGCYSIDIDPVMTPIHIEISVDNDTNMRCELSAGCQNPVAGGKLELGETMVLPEDFKLHAVVPFALEDATQVVNVSTFSSMAYSLAMDKAKNNGEPLNAMAVGGANSKINDLLLKYDLLEIGEQYLSIALVDVSSSQELQMAVENGAPSRVRLALASSAMMSITEQSYDNNLIVSLGALNSHYVDNDGDLSLVKAADENFAMQEILEISQSELNELVNREKELSFAEVESDFQQALDRIKTELGTEENPHSESDKSEGETPQQEDEVDEGQQDPVDSTPVEDEVAENENENSDGNDNNPSEPNNDKANKDQDKADKEKTTDTEIANALEQYLFDDVAAAKDLIKSLRTFGHTFEENARDIGINVLDAYGGQLDVTGLSESATDFSEVAKKIYPSMGKLIMALMSSVEDYETAESYDLATDISHLLPDDVAFSGTVLKYQQWGQVVIELKDGFIEGIGEANFSLRFSQTCYYCTSSAYVAITGSVNGEYGEIEFSDWGAYVTRDYNWWRGRYMPSHLRVTDGRLTIKLGDKSVDDRVSFTGETDFALNWRNEDPNQLPLVDFFNLTGNFYDWNRDLYHFKATVSYYNQEYWRYQTNDPVYWAEQHARYFTLTIGFEADFRVPDPEQPNRSIYESIGLKVGLINQRYKTARWVEVKYGNESFKIERSKQDYNSSYRFSNKVGAIMEMLVNENNEVEVGDISFNGKQVASIENSDVGPIIRYSDGSMESF